MNNTGFNVVGFNTKFEARIEVLKSDPSWITPKLIDDLPKIAEVLDDTTIQTIMEKPRDESIQEIASFLQQSREDIVREFDNSTPIIRADVFRVVRMDIQDRLMREEEEIFIILLALLSRKRFI
jgi:AraC-like DNA-binding protein